MTSAARSVFVFGIYLIVTGAILMGSPGTLLALLQLPPAGDYWIRVLGVPVMAIGLTYLACARMEQTGFFRATLTARSFVFVALSVMAVMGAIPPIVAGFGVVDLAGALWTFTALRKTPVNVPA